MTIKPINDNVIIEVKEEDSKVRASGIIVVSKEETITSQGVVVATGRGRILQNGDRLPIAVDEGDTVLFNRYAGTKIQVENKEYLLMKENDILATL